MLRILIATLVLLSLPVPACAAIYKCRLANGTTEISNRPCPAGSGTLTVRQEEPVSETSRQQAERDVERMRNYVEKREAAQRAEEAAEREERAASQRQSSQSPRVPRQYGSPEECLGDIAPMAMEATLRAQMEAECRNIAKPQTVYVPVAVPTHVPPPHLHQRRAPQAEPPAAPRIAMPPPK